MVDHVDVQMVSNSNSGAYLADFRPGTSSAYVNIRVWCDALAWVKYTFNVYVRGPHGVAYQ